MKLVAHVSLADTDYGGVLLDERAGTYWQLNPTGLAVLRAVLEGSTVEEAAHQLAETYDVGAEEAREDAAGLVRQLRDKGFIAT